MANQMTHGVAPRAHERATNLLYGLTLLLAAILPFELIDPIVSLPWFVFTSVEIVLIVTALAWAAIVAGGMPASLRNWRSSAAASVDLLLPVALFLLLALLSALLAPSHRLEALKVVARLATGIFAFALAVHVTRTEKRLAGLLWAIIVSSAASACLGLLEAWNWTALTLLGHFKDAPTLVGGALRVSATFQYATIAAMFFEMVVPLAVCLAAASAYRHLRVVATIAACLCAIVVVLTLTRTSYVTLAAVLILYLALAWRHARWRSLVVPAALSLLALFVALAALSLASPQFRTRMVTENDAGWYGATYVAPATATIKSGEVLTITIGVHNNGQATWHSQGDHAFALGCRWLTAQDRQELMIAHTETALPEDAPPGATLTLIAPAPATPPAGEFRLSCGMLQHGILWFRSRNVPEAETLVEVVPGGQAPNLPLVASNDDAVVIPPTLPRRTLWSAAGVMLRERPLFGVGPGNFRHVHGLYLGLPAWDRDVHANNLYIELAADLGLPGLFLFLWLLLAVGLRWRRAVSSSSPGALALLAIGLGGSLLAFLLHGTLDYYLEFTGLSVLFWMVLGLMVAVARLAKR